MKILTRFLYLIIIFNTGVFAQNYALTDSSSSDSGIHDAHGNQNHIAIFTGVTSQLEKVGNHFSLGLDYVRKFSVSGNWAGSVFAEAIFSEHTEMVFGFVIYHRLGEAFWIRTGPGIEIIPEEDHESHDHTMKSRVEFLYRIGCGYPFHFEAFTIAPSVDLDIVRSATALVWGINIAKSF